MNDTSEKESTVRRSMPRVFEWSGFDRSMKTRLFHSMVSTMHFIVSIRSSSGERRKRRKRKGGNTECRVWNSDERNDWKFSRDSRWLYFYFWGSSIERREASCFAQICVQILYEEEELFFFRVETASTVFGNVKLRTNWCDFHFATSGCLKVVGENYREMSV